MHEHPALASTWLMKHRRDIEGMLPASNPFKESCHASFDSCPWNKQGGRAAWASIVRCFQQTKNVSTAIVKLGSNGCTWLFICLPHVYSIFLGYRSVPPRRPRRSPTFPFHRTPTAHPKQPHLACGSTPASNASLSIGETARRTPRRRLCCCLRLRLTNPIVPPCTGNPLDVLETECPIEPGCVSEWSRRWT